MTIRPKFAKNNLGVIYAAAIFIPLFFTISCKKDLKSSEKNLDPSSIQSSIVDSNAFPRIVDFVNAALNDTLPFNDIEYYHSTEYFNAYLNYLYVPQNTDNLLVENIDTINYSVSVHNIGGNYFLNSNGIRGLIDSLNTEISQVAILNGFNSNSDLDFMAVKFAFNGDIVNNTIPIQVILHVGLPNTLTGCSFSDDFASRDVTRSPNSGDGACFNSGGQNYGFKQLRSTLNNTDCNENLGCVDYLDFTPQGGTLVNGPYTTYTSKIAFSNYEITPPTDWNLWYSLSPNSVYNCVTSSTLSAYNNHCKTTSTNNRPTYNVPNTTTTIDKSIDYYIYDQWIEDVGSTSIPLGSYYHFCTINYNVCVLLPIYPVAIKNHDDWRDNL